ncbi:MAG: glycosyltransferase family 39 protein, partial [Verrucomicrobiota bacterium]|nr:glycosyltransferase family 39 protein [Verrucomicrobiota bacterium]
MSASAISEAAPLLRHEDAVTPIKRAPARPAAGITTTRAVWIFVALLTAIRLTLLGTVDLSFDEAHYWMWSERLAPSYFSKGPGVAYAIWSSVALFGPTEFGVRFWSPVLAGGTSLLLFYFTRRLFNDLTAFWLVLAMNVTPIFNVGAFLMTTDPLAILCWSAAMFAFWLALERSPRFSLYWPLTGLLIGIGFVCRYTNAFQLLSVVAVLALVPRLRGEFRRPGLVALLAVFALCTLPIVLWNQQHTWVTVTHLRTRGALDHPPGVHPQELFSFLAMHFAVYSPLLAVGILGAVIGSWKRARQQCEGTYLLAFGVPVFAAYFLLSLNHAANAHWDGLAFVSLGVLATAFWRQRFQARPSVGRWAAAAMLLALFLSVIALNSELLRSAAGRHFHWRDPADRMRSWQAASQAVEEVRAAAETQLQQPLFVIADERDRASEFAFYFREKRSEAAGHPPVYIVESPGVRNQFS